MTDDRTSLQRRFAPGPGGWDQGSLKDTLKRLDARITRKNAAEIAAKLGQFDDTRRERRRPPTVFDPARHLPRYWTAEELPRMAGSMPSKDHRHVYETVAKVIIEREGFWDAQPREMAAACGMLLDEFESVWAYVRRSFVSTRKGWTARILQTVAADALRTFATRALAGAYGFKIRSFFGWVEEYRPKVGSIDCQRRFQDEARKRMGEIEEARQELGKVTGRRPAYRARFMQFLAGAGISASDGDAMGELSARIEGFASKLKVGKEKLTRCMERPGVKHDVMRRVQYGILSANALYLLLHDAFVPRRWPSWKESGPFSGAGP